jgi:class 3 adenylate cyclase
MDELVRDLESIESENGCGDAARDQEANVIEPPPREPIYVYVLFIDMVSFSSLPMDEGLELVELLTKTVAQTPRFQQGAHLRELMVLDTGDGMALVFFDTIVAPVKSAIELSRAVRERPRLRLRMGIHVGPAFRRFDPAGRENISGDAINLAQRVMDCGGAGHILLSSEAASGVGRLSAYQHDVHDIGVFTVKHKQRIHVYNLYGKDYGNSEVPERLQKDRLRKRALGAVFAVAVLCLALGWFRYARTAAPSSGVPPKPAPDVSATASAPAEVKDDIPRRQKMAVAVGWAVGAMGQSTTTSMRPMFDKSIESLGLAQNDVRLLSGRFSALESKIRQRSINYGVAQARKAALLSEVQEHSRLLSGEEHPGYMEFGLRLFDLSLTLEYWERLEQDRNPVETSRPLLAALQESLKRIRIPEGIAREIFAMRVEGLQNASNRKASMQTLAKVAASFDLNP